MILSFPASADSTVIQNSNINTQEDGNKTLQSSNQLSCLKYILGDPSHQLEEEAQLLESFKSQFTNAQHEEAQKKADELINSKNYTAQPAWLNAKKHSKMVLLWFGYLGLAFGGKMALILSEPNLAYLNIHYTNFFFGVPFMGIAHHSLCALSDSCKVAYNSLTNEYKKRFGKSSHHYTNAISSIAEDMSKDGFSSAEKTKLGIFILTGLMFTYFNTSYELLYYEDGLLDPLFINGLTPRGIDRDWVDFGTGQMALVAYYFIQKIHSKNLGLNSTP